MLRLDKLLVVVLDEKSTGPERAARLLKTWALARVLGLDEHMPPAEQEALEAAAILREIGAALSEELYGDTLPEHQAEFAPGAAQSLLERLDAGEETARRVAALLSRPRQPEAAGAEGLLAEAEQTIAALAEMPAADLSDVCTLRGFLYMTRIVQDPARNGQRYYLDVMDCYEKALKANPDNALARQLQEKFFEGMRAQ